MRPPSVPALPLNRKGANQTPERRLIIAIIEDAIQCVRQNVDTLDGPRRQEFLHARAWLLDDRRDWPFAFANLCDLLDLDIAAVREHLPLQRFVLAVSKQPADESSPTDQATVGDTAIHQSLTLELHENLFRLKAELLSVRRMRRGSLVVRYRKCGKSNCYCANVDSPGHGPIFSLTWQTNGKTRTKIIPAHAAEDVKQQIAEYKRFRRLCADIVQVNEKISDDGIKSGRVETKEPFRKPATVALKR